ncbi:MAG: helix-turn-helix transcriptional regulator [Bdellovibrionaceae bacterium]|jgi:transcriptional regulator with XRE-family HTH domain|nr:helix-turn-helix transcriptional regulator [Pseudobdellovibrionaceae bacterium]
MKIQFKKWEKERGRLTCGKALSRWREFENLSMSEAARLLGISKSSYQDLESELRIPSPKRALVIASKLKFPKITFIELAIRDSLYKNELKFNVKLDPK